MGDNTWECNVTFKGTEEVQTFMLDKKHITSYDYLESKLVELFPQLQAGSFTVTWTNKDGEEVRVSVSLVIFTKSSVHNADSHQ